LQALEADQNSLEAEIPSTLTAALKADQAIIEKAFSSMGPAQMKALHTGGPHGMAPGSDPTAHLTAELTAAGVSSAQANAIVVDFRNLKSALTTTDPTLQAKLAADKAAIAKDGGPTFLEKGPGMPGMF
jgi:hypothetical protein